MIDVAMRYAALDLHVIPVHVLVDGECTCPIDSDTRKDSPDGKCKSPGKHPAITGWQRKASTNSKTINGWFSGDARNIGIVCGPSGIIVVDIDPRNGGRETFADLEQRLGALPVTPTADTGGNGEHRLFRSVPVDLDSKLGTGVDLQRGPRQIVVEPSIHPSGKQYRWRAGLAPGDVPIAEFPAAWLDFATRKPAPPRTITYATLDHEKQAKRAVAYVERMAPSVQGEHGSGRLYAATCRVMHGFALDDNTAATIITNHFNPRCDPPWSEREIEHCIRSARKHRDPGMWHVEDRPKADDLSRARAKRQGQTFTAPVLPGTPQPDLRHAGLGPEGGYRCTDLGNARRFADMHRDRMRYVFAWNQWLVWDGKRWRRDDGGVVGQAAKAVNAAIYNDAARCMASAAAAINAGGSVGPSAAEALMKWGNDTAKRARIDAMIALSRDEQEIRAQAHEFDRDPWLLNVANGTIDLRDGELRSHSQADAITMLAPVEYDADAKAPEWERFLAQVIPDQDVLDWTQRYLGYALTGLVTEQKFAFWVGKGGNGKNVCADVVTTCLGEYAMVGAPDLLLEKHGDTHPTELADIEGKRLVVCSEIEPGRSWAEARIKQITGDKTIKARRMKQDFYEFAATGKLIVLANTKPKVRSTDNGLWRRMCLQPWVVQVPKAEQDKQLLHRIITNELPGVLAWLVRGCLAWQNRGLTEPRAVVVATGDYQRQEDVLGLWIADNCKLGDGLWAGTTALYEDYKAWCKDEGIEKPWTLKAWKARLIEREGISDRPRESARGLSGISLRGLYERENE